MDDTTSILDSRPVVRVGRRFLPVPAAALPPMPEMDGLVDLPLAPGTPVHAMQSGRVVAVESSSTGEVVIRIADELRLVYRKLLPSSVTVGAGDTVEAGDIVGVVAAAAAGTLAGLQLGVQRPDGSWERVCDAIVGLPDPIELFLRPPVSPPRAPPRRSRATSKTSPLVRTPDTSTPGSPARSSGVPKPGSPARSSGVPKPATPSTPGSVPGRDKPAEPAPSEPERVDAAKVTPKATRSQRRSAPEPSKDAASSTAAPSREVTSPSSPPESPSTPTETRPAGAAKLASRRRGRPARSRDDAAPAPQTPQIGEPDGATETPAAVDAPPAPPDADSDQPARVAPPAEGVASAPDPVAGSRDTPEPGDEPAGSAGASGLDDEGDRLSSENEWASDDALRPDTDDEAADENEWASDDALRPDSDDEAADENERASKASRLSGRRQRPRRRT